jgi:hypothetical protein
VIIQAERYTTYMEAPYSVTCNGERFVIFKTFKVGVPFAQHLSYLTRKRKCSKP